MNDLTCAGARELLLDAEPVVLLAHGDTPLERHLRSCDACAAAALQILRAQTSLADALDTLSRGATADAAADPTVQTHTAPAAAVLTPRARRRWFARAAPLAAAAALLLVLWQPELRRDEVAVEPILLPQEDVPDMPVVNAPATGTVAVMQTSNPSITVVWHF